MLLAAAYAKHPEVLKILQAKQLSYETLWPLWDSMDLDVDSRRQMLKALILPRLDAVFSVNDETSLDMEQLL